MPVELTIKIEESGGTVTFNPSTQNVSIALQQKVFWANYDCEAHWPALKLPDGSINKLFFIQKQVDGKKPDEPAPTSDAVALQSPGTFRYVCAFHSNEGGTIVVS